MIRYYKHRAMSSLTPQEIDLLGNDGILEFSRQSGIPFIDVYDQIKALERKLKNMPIEQFDMSTGKNNDLFNEWVEKYITFFNKHAKHNRQAYVLLGNIASGKSTFAKSLEKSKQAIIIDPDRFKMGEHTKHGFFEGFTSLYQEDTDRERLQEPSSAAAKMVLDNVSATGMDIIFPKATTSLEKLHKQLQILRDRGYDIHLIQIEAPIEDCANRNYFRYLINEYQKDSHGRFVPVQVIKDIGDQTFTTFAKAYKEGRFTSYRAFYNDKYTAKTEIDLTTMKDPENEAQLIVKGF